MVKIIVFLELEQKYAFFKGLCIAPKALSPSTTLKVRSFHYGIQPALEFYKGLTPIY